MFGTESTTSCQHIENATTCYHRNKVENVSNVYYNQQYPPSIAVTDLGGVRAPPFGG